MKRNKKKLFNWKIILISIFIIAVIVGFFVMSNRCDYNDPNKNYVAKSVNECAVIGYMCQPNEEYFSNDCGCGCEIKK